MAALAVLSGISCMLGAVRPGSLLALLPSLGVAVWGGALFLGGATIASGLIRKTYPIRMAIGLRLVGILFVAYAVAVLIVAGLQTGGVTAAFMAMIAVLCLFRAFFLRATAETAARIGHEEEDVS
jgi:hypothetical protein